MGTITGVWTTFVLNVVQVVIEIHIFSGNIVDSTIVNSAALKVLFHFFQELHSINSSDSESEHLEPNVDEESLVKYYFHRGFTYEEILQFLEKHHNHNISYNTLLRRLKQYGLSRKQQLTDNTKIWLEIG